MRDAATPSMIVPIGPRRAAGRDGPRMRPSTLAAIRYGYGRAPGGTGPADAEALLTALAAPDRARAAHPLPGLGDGLALLQANRDAQRARRTGAPGAQEALNETRRGFDAAMTRSLRAGLARIATGDAPFRERLTWFWADHFTVVAKQNNLRALVPDYLDNAIRAHVAGRFADMLGAALGHPLMLAYLDQRDSVGPGSRRGRRQGGGLNENLARETLELHTLGVGAAYSQADVRQFAELLTGLTFNIRKGTVFVPNRAEPGAEAVLGRRYGGARPRRADITRAIEDLSVHPATARHLSRKLAVHFVSDTPDPGLVAHMARAWQAGGGDLARVYAAMLEHPAAWAPGAAKARQPFDFIAAALVALGLDGAAVTRLKGGDWRRAAPVALRRMGQPFFTAPGPDGWPEAAEAWITPPGLAARINWAMEMPARLLEGELPDPRALVDSALGAAAGPDLRFAAGAAESRRQGVGLVLASAEFNRR